MVPQPHLNSSNPLKYLLTLLTLLLLITQLCYVEAKSFPLTTSPVDDSGFISAVGQIDCLPYSCSRIKELNLIPRFSDHLDPNLITVKAFQIGVCSKTWAPATTNHVIFDNQIHTVYDTTEASTIYNGSTSLTIQLRVAYTGDQKSHSVRGHDLVLVVQTVQGVDVQLVAPVLYTIFSSINPLLIPKGTINLFDRNYPSQSQSQLSTTTFALKDTIVGDAVVPKDDSVGGVVAAPNDTIIANGHGSGTAAAPLYWSGMFNTVSNYTKLFSVPTHLNFTVFGQYTLKIPADVDTIDVNGHQCRWKRVNGYTLVIQLNSQLVRDFQYESLFTIRFPQTWFIDQSATIFSCPIDTENTMNIRPHFILSLFNKDDIHFIRDFSLPHPEDDDRTKNYVVESGTHPLPSFTTSFSFFETASGFFFTVMAFDFAGVEDHFVEEQIKMALNLKTSFDFVIDETKYGKQRFDLLLSKPRSPINESDSAVEEKMVMDGDDDINNIANDGEKYLTFITPNGKSASLEWTLPHDLYPEESPQPDSFSENDENNKKDEKNRNDDSAETLTSPLPRMVYHTVYGYIQDRPITDIPAQTTMTITTETKAGDSLKGFQWTSSPVSSAQSIPTQSIVLDTTEVDIKTITPSRYRYELQSLKILFTQLNKASAFVSSPKQVIISLPQPNLVFINTALGVGSENGPICTWQYVALLNSQVTPLRGTISWFASAPSDQRHFEWPPTEWAPGKRILFTFSDELSFNPFTTAGGDAILDCPTVSIVSLAGNQFISSGSNFPYKNLGMWNQTNVVPPNNNEKEKVSEKKKKNNAISFSATQENNEPIHPNQLNHPNRQPSQQNSYTKQPIYSLSSSDNNQQNTISTPIGTFRLSTDMVTMREMVMRGNEQITALFDSTRNYSNEIYILLSNYINSFNDDKHTGDEYFDEEIIVQEGILFSKGTQKQQNNNNIDNTTFNPNQNGVNYLKDKATGPKKPSNPDGDLLLTTQFVMNDRSNVYAIYQTTIIANYRDKVKVHSIDLDLFKVIKTVIVIAIPVIIVGMIAFALYQAVNICCRLRRQGNDGEDVDESNPDNSNNHSDLSSLTLSTSSYGSLTDSTQNDASDKKRKIKKKDEHHEPLLS